MAEQDEHVDVELGGQPLDGQLGMDGLGHDATGCRGPVAGIGPWGPGQLAGQPGDRVAPALVDAADRAGTEEVAGQPRPSAFGCTAEGSTPRGPGSRGPRRRAAARGSGRRRAWRGWRPGTCPRCRAPAGRWCRLPRPGRAGSRWCPIGVARRSGWASIGQSRSSGSEQGGGQARAESRVATAGTRGHRTRRPRPEPCRPAWPLAGVAVRRPRCSHRPDRPALIWATASSWYCRHEGDIDARRACRGTAGGPHDRRTRPASPGRPVLVVGVEDLGERADRPGLRAAEPEVPVLARGEGDIDGQIVGEHVAPDDTEGQGHEVEPQQLSGPVARGGRGSSRPGRCRRGPPGATR